MKRHSLTERGSGRCRRRHRFTGRVQQIAVTVLLEDRTEDPPMPVKIRELSVLQ